MWNPKPCSVAEEEADEGEEEKEEEEGEEEAGEEISRGQTHTALHIHSRETRATDVLDGLCMEWHFWQTDCFAMQ